MEPQPLSATARALAGLTRGNAAYLEDLNPEQRRAVETTQGPLLVLAGAGTGKTRVLTTRVAHLVNERLARPSDILAVTFTNKAAREMNHRVATLLGPAASPLPWIGTFHSIGAKILRRHAELVGLKSDFTILDTTDQIRLLKQILHSDNIDEKRWPARVLAHTIDSWKNRGLVPSKVSSGEAQAFANGKGALLYTAYQERLRTLNAADFGDLLLHCLQLWHDNRDVLELYQSRYRYILVDEYQDTNVAQYLWLRLLAQKHQNIACVGDDDQSIYGWRGAEVDNILRFEHDFPGAAVVRLERNYRSTGHILTAASGLIAKNEHRLGKTLRTESVVGEPVTILGAWDSEEEARLLGESIESLQHHRHELAQIAVLVRISAQMREIEDRFVQLGLPYRVIGGPRFYERAEIRDALAYLRLSANNTDDLAFERIFNTPKRGLGPASLQLLHTYGRTHSTSLLAAAKRIVETDEIKPRIRSILRNLVADISRWSNLIDKTTHFDLAQKILEESGYTEMWQKERSADAAGRLENLKEFVRSMEDFPDLASFLEHVALVTELSEAEGADRVSLMTLHAAKGLEFDTVFLPGWEEGLFPNQRALDENGRAGLEEERRLAHVGLTRARKQAKISFAVNRRIHGLCASTIPARFIDELPEAAIEIIDSVATPPNGASRFDHLSSFQSSYDTPGWRRVQTNMARYGSNKPERRPARHQIEGELVARSVGTLSSFTIGTRVHHDKFGPGNIIAVDGNKLTVSFDKAGQKLVLDSFVVDVSQK